MAIRIRAPADPASRRASDHPWEIDQAVLADGVDWSMIFGRSGPVEMEIGCGKGLFLSRASAGHPEVNWLGVERSSEHLRRAIDRAVKARVENVRFVKAGAEDLLRSWLPDASLRAVHILYPDPWPKKRHHKRRLLGLQQGPATVRHLARVVEPGGHLAIATDHTGYAEVIMQVMRGAEGFEREETFYSQSLFADGELPLTEFERKYRLEGRLRHRFSWRRR